jgi:hypothetical protein
MIAARRYFSVQAGLGRQRGSSLPARTDSVVDPEPERTAWLVLVRGDWCGCATALEGFAPTPEMPEIAEAQARLVAIEGGAYVRHEQ